MIALATVLSLLKIWEAPLGGSVTLFSMTPILVFGLRHGAKKSFFIAFVFSCLQLLLGIGTVSWVPGWRGILLCILFDYLLAFSSLGVSGFFRIDQNEPRGKKAMKVILATLAACLLRYGFHVLSGAVVWYEITKAGNWNDYVQTVGMWTYSVVYNLQFMLPESILTMVASPAMLTVLRLAPTEKEKTKK